MLSIVTADGGNSPATRRRSTLRTIEDESRSPMNKGKKMSRNPSMQFLQTSTRRLTVQQQNVPTKQPIPPHLLKLLQKSPEQLSRLDTVKQILIDPPGMRTELHLDVVYEWMQENCKQYSNNIFGTAPEYIRREICRQMRLIKYIGQQPIICQGDTGDRCYIVVDGLVDVYIKKIQPSDTENPSSTIESGTPTLAQLYGNVVATLGPGAMFGEVVLMNPSARRNASILGSQYTDTCELIFLERADYIRLVRTASMEASHYTQAEILDQMYLFQNWSKNDKMRLVSTMRSMHFLRTEYLYRARTEAKWMYIIVSGEVMERGNWSLGRSNNEGSSSSIAGPLIMSASTPVPSAYSNPDTKVNVDLMIVGAGDVVGELPFVKNKWGASFDIRAIVDVQVLALDRRVFESMIMNVTTEVNPIVATTFQELKRLTKAREEWRQQRLDCGACYPDAHVSMSHQLMRMAQFKCSRCGQVGHLATDTSRCIKSVSPKKASNAVLPHRTSHASPKKSPFSSPRQDATIRELWDENYLPTAHEQLQQCRRELEQKNARQIASMPSEIQSRPSTTAKQLDVNR